MTLFAQRVFNDTNVYSHINIHNTTGVFVNCNSTSNLFVNVVVGLFVRVCCGRCLRNGSTANRSTPCWFEQTRKSTTICTPNSELLSCGAAELKSLWFYAIRPLVHVGKFTGKYRLTIYSDLLLDCGHLENSVSAVGVIIRFCICNYFCICENLVG